MNFDVNTASGTPLWISVSNFVQIRAIAAELRFCQKYKMAAVRHLGLLFATLDNPRRLFGDGKHMFKFHINRVNTFEVIVIWKFHKFGLKRLFPPPKFSFLGILTPNINFDHRDPQKALPWPKTRVLTSHASQSVQRYGQDSVRRIQKRVHPRWWQTWYYILLWNDALFLFLLYNICVIL